MRTMSTRTHVPSANGRPSTSRRDRRGSWSTARGLRSIRAGDISVDLQTVADEASVYWDDQFNFGYGDTLAQWSGTAMVPVLEYTTAAQPPTVLPGQPFTIDASIVNVGHADAVNVSISLPMESYVGLASLEPFAPGEARTVSGIGATAPRLFPPSNYFSDFWYIYALQFLRDTPLQTLLSWQDLAYTGYQRYAYAGTQLIVPIVSITQTPSAGGPLFLRDRLDLTIGIRSEGTADAINTSVTLSFGAVLLRCSRRPR